MKPLNLADGISIEDAQLTSHLAVLEGVGEDVDMQLDANRNRTLTAALDALAAEAAAGKPGLIGAPLGAAGPLISKWGSDPAWGSEPTARGLYIHQFPLRTAVGTRVPLPGQNEPAVIVGHPVQFDAARGLWYCDLQLNAGDAYQPFVDLALVRYQPYSINGYEASAVVRPGFIQVVPDRTAAITPMTDRTLLISVRGPSGYNRFGEDFMFGSPPAMQVDASREVTVQLQTRPAGGSDLEWRPQGEPKRLHAAGSNLGDIRWNGTVLVLPAAEDDEQRLLITEYELFETDASQAETWVIRPAGGVGEASRKPAGKRLVFATEFSV